MYFYDADSVKRDLLVPKSNPGQIAPLLGIGETQGLGSSIKGGDLPMPLTRQA